MLANSYPNYQMLANSKLVLCIRLPDVSEQLSKLSDVS